MDLFVHSKGPMLEKFSSFSILSRMPKFLPVGGGCILMY